MATEIAKRALERMKKKKSQKTKPTKKEIVNGVDISDVPKHIRDIIRSMADDKSSKEKPDQDFICLVREAMKLHSCDVYEAISRVNKAVPQAQSDFVNKAKPAIDRKYAAYAGDLDPMDFEKVVRQYQKDYSCDRQTAYGLIQKDHPGYQRAYVEAVNK
jgi:hypothetical protein